MHHEFQAYDYTNLRLKKSGDRVLVENPKFRPEDQKHIDDFRAAAKMLNDHLPPHLTDGVIYRFLYANDMDLDKARAVSIFFYLFLYASTSFYFYTTPQPHFIFIRG